MLGNKFMRKLEEYEGEIIKKIYCCFKRQGFFEKRISYRVFAVVLHIKYESLVSLDARGNCINIFTKDFLYKMQVYGGSVKRDLYNRGLFAELDESIISPAKVERNHPYTIKMPILESARINDEEVVKYILDKMGRMGYETQFKMQNYTFLIEGINILECYKNGTKAAKRLRKYIQQKEGTNVREGIVHGDFHRGNILYRGGRPVLIDFDSARQRDIQDVDALYYILEEERYENGYRRSWMDEWLKIYKNTSIIYKYRYLGQVDIELKFGLILLLLERLAQNQRENNSFAEQNKAVLEKINREILLL